MASSKLYTALAHVQNMLASNAAAHFFISVPQSTDPSFILGIRKNFNSARFFSAIRGSELCVHALITYDSFVTFSRRFYADSRVKHILHSCAAVGTQKASFARILQSTYGEEIYTYLYEYLQADARISEFRSLAKMEGISLKQQARIILQYWVESDSVQDLRKLTQMPATALVLYLVQNQPLVQNIFVCAHTDLVICAARLFRPKNQAQVREVVTQAACEAVLGLESFLVRDGLHKKHTITQVEAKLLAKSRISVLVDLATIRSDIAISLHALRVAGNQKESTQIAQWVFTRLNRVRLLAKLARKYNVLGVCFTSLTLESSKEGFRVENLTQDLATFCE